MMTSMRRWVLIILLLVYPFQLALAVADKCCVTTSTGVTHHSEDRGAGEARAASAFVAGDDASGVSDPHCPACSFGHSSCIPTDLLVTPAGPHASQAVAFIPLFPTSPPADRFERPKWPSAA
ncbi:hypothetical protein [Massilia sp. 2TAF26]|uniref:hypothetical protein n=1 Tax=Massilia sp. 2TAF26 TaxID=3233012 RepID=UPI003F956037